MLTFVAALIGGCSSTIRYSSVSLPSSSSSASGHSITNNYILSEKQTKVIETARGFLGTPYCYGGEGNDCFDCSGFVNAVYRSAGIDLPRVSRDIYKVGTNLSLSQAEPGDLVFFKKNGKINHVGIYYGNGQMIHASTSRGVMIQSLSDNYYKKRYAGVRRIIK
jgi:cell wall-associated NlpC family hydrolase